VNCDSVVWCLTFYLFEQPVWDRTGRSESASAACERDAREIFKGFDTECTNFNGFDTECEIFNGFDTECTEVAEHTESAAGRLSCGAEIAN
jgi:hypothetical protein